MDGERRHRFLLPVRQMIVCRAVAMAIVLVFAYGCGSADREVRRLPSPDSVVEAVIVVVEGGATVSLFHRVFIVSKGGPTRPENQILRADRVENLRVVWSDRRRLFVCFDQARIFEFTNFWHARDVENFNYVVDVRLVQPPDRASGCGVAAGAQSRTGIPMRNRASISPCPDTV